MNNEIRKDLDLQRSYFLQIKLVMDDFIPIINMGMAG